jgi:glycosyltransferase involved in cell wall biosynthesis
MKIALLANELYPLTIGGMQKHSYYLARYLARQSIQVDVYYAKPEKEGQKEELLENFSSDELDNLTFYKVEVPSSMYFPGHYMVNSYRYSINIYEKLKNKLDGIDFIYVQGFSGLKLLRKSDTINNLPPIGVNFHGLEMFQIAANVSAKLERYLFRQPATFCLRKADVAFSLGGKLTDIVKKRAAPSTVVLETPIGIEDKWLNESITRNFGKRKFIFIGRYERRKGIQELNRAIKKLNTNHAFDVEFIGPIPDQNRLNAPNCQYHGPIYDEDTIIKIVTSGDVLVCPSYSEGMPTVILEAMARGLAVVATDVGAVSELVSAETGWLIEPASQPQLEQALAQAIEISEGHLYQKRKAAHERIEKNFSWSTVIKQTLHQVEEYLSGSMVHQ